MRVGSRILALPGTVTHMFSEGRVGTVAELRDPRPYSDNNSNNLVRWDGDIILLGFKPENVEECEDGIE